MFERQAAEYREQKQAYLKYDWDSGGDCSHGLVRIGKFKLNPVRDRVVDCSPERYINRPAYEGEVSSVPVTVAKHALRHLPWGASVELYFGSMPEEEREKFRKAFPEAKEIEDD